MRVLKPGFARPVIVHRAILGSVERMFAILCEHTGGKWPFWLSPRQVRILPIKDDNLDYARKVLKRLVMVNPTCTPYFNPSLLQEGFEAELDDSNGTMNAKVRNAQLAQFNFMCVIGP